MGGIAIAYAILRQHIPFLIAAILDLEEILVQGQPLASGAVYTVAMPDYVAMMQDVYLNIDLPPQEDLGVTLSQAIVATVEVSGPIHSQIEGRIRRLDGTNER